MGSVTRISLIASCARRAVSHGACRRHYRLERQGGGGEVQARQAPFVHTRSVAIVHVAMFDAVARLIGAMCLIGYKCAPLPEHRVRRLPPLLPTSPWSVSIRTKRGCRYLLSHVAGGGPGWGAEVKRHPAGEEVAAEILSLCERGRRDAPNTYRPYTAAGTYVPTALLSAPVGAK
jgi:hypothetical protein